MLSVKSLNDRYTERQLELEITKILDCLLQENHKSSQLKKKKSEQK